MNTAPYSEEMIFLITLLGGMLLGFLWDVYRLIRRYVPFGKFFTAIGDVIYWLIALYIGLNLIIAISWGNVRIYIFLGFFLGIILYFLILSRYIICGVVRLIDFSVKYAIKLLNLIIFPLKILIKFLKNLLKPYKIYVLTKINRAKKKYKYIVYKRNVNKKIKKYKKLREKQLKIVKECTDGSKGKRKQSSGTSGKKEETGK